MLTTLRKTLLDTSKRYLLRDLFAGDAAAGTLNGTPASGGPGVRTVTDTENKLSVVGGVLSFAGGKATPEWGDPGIWYGAVERVAGRTMISYSVLADAVSYGMCGFDTAIGGQLSYALYINGGVLSITGGLALGTYAADSYKVACVARASGTFYFVKGGAFAHWTLVWADGSGSLTPLYPGVSVYNAALTADNIRIPAQLWLPSPLASDSFTRANGALVSTDGLGHAEQNGGNGLAWTFDSGVWTVAGNVAVGTPTLGAELDSGNLVVGNWYSITLDTVGSYFYAGSATGQAFRATATTALTALEKVKQITPSSLFASVTVSTPDVLAEAAVTLTAGTQAGLVLNLDSAATPANFVIAYHNGTNCLLEKCVAGVYTTVISAAATYSAGAVLRVIKDGTAYRLYYNNALVGTGTISDAGIVSNARHGLFSTYSGNSFDNFVVWARGTGGEYSALDSF